MLLEVQAVNHLSCHLSYMHITKRDCSMQKFNPWGPSAVEEGFCSSVFIFFFTFASKGFNPERDAYMCTYLILYEYLATAQKKTTTTTTSDVFFCISVERFNNLTRLVRQRNRRRAWVLPPSQCSWANRDVDVYLCFYLNFWNSCTCTSCTSLPDGFHFLLVKCALKCGVDHTWRRTSASLNFECFQGHQVKLK